MQAEIQNETIKLVGSKKKKTNMDFGLLVTLSEPYNIEINDEPHML